MRVALATSRDFPDLFFDDEALRTALRARGVEVDATVWDDGHDWGSYDLVVVRSTWDYHERRDAYLAWAATVPRLANPFRIVAWNTDKTYLRSLASAGVPVVPTAWSPASLRDVPWDDVVVKPAISAGARDTLHCRRDDPAGEALRQRIDGTVMVQPYLASVEDYGERSLLYVDGVLTHAVRRNPALSMEGDARYDAQPVTAAPDEIAVAEAALAAVGERLLYARVDVVRDDAGTPLLIELEVTEPQLFLRYAPHAAEALADATVARAGSAGSSTTTGS